MKLYMKLGVVITASFCTLNKIVEVLKELKNAGYDIYPILSNNIIENNTRFGKAEDIVNEIETITERKVVKDIVEAEKFGAINKMDAMIVIPATGDFIAKMANGITDNAPNLAIKATIRNQKPIIIAISTNDGLGLSGQNIMKLFNLKNIYFVPFGQDDFENKPNSLVAHIDMVIPTIEKALQGKQIQPVLKEYKILKRNIKM